MVGHSTKRAMLSISIFEPNGSDRALILCGVGAHLFLNIESYENDNFLFLHILCNACFERIVRYTRERCACARSHVLFVICVFAGFSDLFETSTQMAKKPLRL